MPLYELASGQEEESFSGAIATFARSADRIRIDVEEKEAFKSERSDSNFIEASEQAKRDLELAKSQMHFMKVLDPETAAHELCLIMVAELMRSAEERLSRYGPNLVRASRISPGDLEKMSSKHTEGFERLRTMEIEIGKIRRGSNAD